MPPKQRPISTSYNDLARANTHALSVNSSFVDLSPFGKTALLAGIVELSGSCRICETLDAVRPPSNLHGCGEKQSRSQRVQHELSINCGGPEFAHDYTKASPCRNIDGSQVTSPAIDDEVLKATWNLVDPLRRPPVFAIAALAGVVLAFVMLRSVRIGLMVTASAWFTALVTIALIPAVGHTMNMVTIVMPTLLVVLTISGAIHVANYWRHASASGASNPISEAIRIGWWPCFLANATTAVGLLSLTISQLEPIRDFGIFATIGTLLSYIAVIIGFPAMLRLSSVHPNAQAKKNTNLFWSRAAVTISRHRKAIVLGSGLLALCTGLGLQWLKTEIKVGRYFPEDARLNQDSRFLEENIGGTSSFDLLVHFGAEYNDSHFFLDRMALIRRI